MKIQVSFHEIAEAVRRYANTPDADVIFTARPHNGQLLDLTALVEDSHAQRQVPSSSPVVTAVSKGQDD